MLSAVQVGVLGGPGGILYNHILLKARSHSFGYYFVNESLFHFLNASFNLGGVLGSGTAAACAVFNAETTATFRTDGGLDGELLHLVSFSQ